MSLYNDIMLKSGGAVGKAAAPIRDSIMAATEKLFCTKDRLNKLCTELDLIAFSDVTEYMTLGENGAATWKDPETLKAKGLTRAIKKIKRRKMFRAGKEGEDEVITDEIDFELHPKLEALKEIAEIMQIHKPSNGNGHEVPPMIVINVGGKRLEIGEKSGPKKS